MCPSKCQEDIWLKATLSVIIISILLFYFLQKLYGRKQRTAFEIAGKEISEILKLKTELLAQLKGIAVKTSTEGQLLANELRNLEGQLLAHVQEKCAAIRDEMTSTLQQKHADTTRKFEKLERNVEEFGNETLFFRDGLQRMVRDEEMYEAEVCMRLMETASQTTVGDGLSEDPSKQEELYIASTKPILLAIKNCMDEIVSTSNLNWKKFILEISTFVKQYHKKLEESLKHTLIENMEKLGQMQVDVLMARTGDIEKQLLEISIFLDRKLVDVQVIDDIIKFFNKKFAAFAEKCEMRWDDSCSNFDTSRGILYEAKDNMIFSCSKISRITCSIGQQTTEMKDIASMVEKAVQRANAIPKREALDKTNTKRIEKIVCVVDTMKDTLAKIEEDYCLKLMAISGSLETPRKRFESFAQTVEDLEFFNDFAKNIANRYDNAVGCGEFEYPEDLKDVENMSMTSGDGLSSCRFGESVSEFSFDIMSDHSKNSNFRESRRHLPMGMMISLFTEVIRKAAVEMVEKDGDSLKMKQSPKRNNEELGQKNFNWSSVPSEENLFDINSDGLVANSTSASEDEDFNVSK